MAHVGIDLGTTNTVVSYTDGSGRIRTAVYGNENIIPSVIYFVSKDKFYIGRQAANMLSNNPLAGVKSFKELMGDTKRVKLIAQNGEEIKYRPDQIAGLFLNKLFADENNGVKEYIEDDLDDVIDSVVITVPAKFGDKQLEATKRAAKYANFDNVKLAPEPTAAAVAYEREAKCKNQNILIYDFGGGTFDVAVIRGKNGRYSEVAKDGKKDLGGNKITRALFEYLATIIEGDYGISLPYDIRDFGKSNSKMSEEEYRINRNNLLEETNKIKERLSKSEEEDLQLDLKCGEELIDLRDSIIVTRELFNSLIENLIQETVEITGRVIKEAKEKGIESIDRIVLAGGSSQLLLVKDLLNKEFGKEIEIFAAKDIYALISKGAEILAAEELENVDTTTSSQFGVKANDGYNGSRFEKLIDVDKELPCKGEKKFYLDSSQEQIRIECYEYDVKNYPNAIRIPSEGYEKIDVITINDFPHNIDLMTCSLNVTFEIQKDRTLRVEAVLKDANDKLINNANVCINRESGNLE